MRPKVLLRHCKALNSTVPQYLIDDCQLITATGQCQPQLSDNFKYSILRTRLYLGDHAFTATGPRLWHSLPIHICQPDGLFANVRRSRIGCFSQVGFVEMHILYNRTWFISQFCSLLSCSPRWLSG